MHVLSEWMTRKNLNYNQEFPCFLGQARKRMDNPSKTRTGGSIKYFLCDLAGCLAVASAELRAQTASPPWPDRGEGSALPLIPPAQSQLDIRSLVNPHFLRAVRGSSKTNSDSGTWVNICSGSRAGVHGKMQSCSSQKSFYLILKVIFFLALWKFNRENYQCRNSIYQLMKIGSGIKEWTCSPFKFFEFWINCPLRTWNVVHVSPVQVAAWEPRSPQLRTRCPCSC